MKTYIKPAVAVIAAVAVLLTLQGVTAQPQRDAAAAVVIALKDYEVACKFGNKDDKAAAYAFLMQALRNCEGPR